MSGGSVLVIGGAAFVAQHLLPGLAAGGSPVFATHRPWRTPHAMPGVTWIASDLTDADAPARWPVHCDSIVYLAQSRHWRRFPAEATDVFDVNVAALFRAVEYARRAGAFRFMFASSGSVYSVLRRPAFDRDPIEIAAERDFYVATKLAAEAMLSSYRRFFAVVVLRLFMPYGAGQHEHMLIPQLVHRVRERQPIMLDGQDGLSANPVAVRDVVTTIRRCLALDRTATLNVAGPQILTLREIGHRIGDAVGEAPRFENRPGTTAPFIVGDTSALRATLGWAPEIDFDTGLREWLGCSTAVKDR